MAQTEHPPPSALTSLLEQAAAAFRDAAHSSDIAPGSLDDAPTVAPFQRFLDGLSVAEQHADQLADVDASRVQATNDALDAFLGDLQGCIDTLQAALDKHRREPPPPECAGPASRGSVRRLLAYAHKLSYTTFAPAGYVAGLTPLGNFRPPAPQEWQMRAAQLHTFAETEAATRLPPPAAAATAAAAPSQSAAAPAAPSDASAAMMAALAALGVQLPPGFVPPPPPPGWKEGDELHLPPELIDQLLALQGGAAAPTPAAAVEAAAVEEIGEEAGAPAAAAVGKGLDFGLVLNPDLELASDFEESDSEEGDFDDEY